MTHTKNTQTPPIAKPATQDAERWTLHDTAQMLLRRIAIHGYDDSPTAEALWERRFLISQGVDWTVVESEYRPFQQAVRAIPHDTLMRVREALRDADAILEEKGYFTGKWMKSAQRDLDTLLKGFEG